MKKYKFLISRNKEAYELTRKKISYEISKYYTGWDDDFDRKFDDHSLFFILKDYNDNYLAASRLILAENDHKIPIEYAISDINFNEFSRNEIAEYSGYWFKTPGYGLTLAYLGAVWIYKNLHKNLDIYAIFDSKNIILKNIYLSAMKFQLIDEIFLRYENFYYKNTNEPVVWNLALECAEKRRDRTVFIGSNPAVQSILCLTDY